MRMVLALFALSFLAPAQQPPPPGADQPIDAAGRKQVLEASIEKLEGYYVFPEVAAKMASSLKERLGKGEYDSVTSSQKFAEMLTAQLQEISRDKHLRVRFSSRPLPERGPARRPSDAEMEEMRRDMARDNFGFRKVEILPGNIGYLRLDGFFPARWAAPAAKAAFEFLANCDALIIDLRFNGGGEPPTVALATSYVLEGRVHLNDIWERKENKTEQFWTSPGLSAGGLAKVPMWLLTSSRTFSGGEEFVYNLKNLKRATLIGETTGGGAHPVSGHRINEHFMIGVPFARSINPISKTNWEGTGVEPDIKTPAPEALDRAVKEAFDHLISKASPEDQKRLERARQNAAGPR